MYFGLQWESECYCGNSYGSQGKGGEACGREGVNCGDGLSTCGNYNAVYSMPRNVEGETLADTLHHDSFTKDFSKVRPAQTGLDCLALAGRAVSCRVAPAGFRACGVVRQCWAPNCSAWQGFIARCS